MYHKFRVRVNIDFFDLFRRITRERQNSIQLWYLARAIDQAGSGKVEIDLLEASKVLNRSLKTIRQWAETLIRRKIFKSAVWNSDRTTINVYLISELRLAKKMRLSGLANAVDIAVTDLPKAKLICTHAWVEVKQRGSQFHASKGGKRTLFTYENLIKPSSALGSGARGKIFRRNRRFVYVSSTCTTFGGSQKKVGWEQDRHRTTVTRRLSRERREKEGLDHIERVQVLKLRADSDRILGTDEERPYKTIVHNGYLYDFKCNVYKESDLTILSNRCAKRRYKSFLRRSGGNKKSS